MRRLLGVSVCIAVVLALVPASRAEAFTTTFSVPSDGTTVTVTLPGGVYTVTSSGTYNYFNVGGLVYLADAECSVDHPFFDGVVDQVAHDFLGVGYPDLYPSPLSEWQRYRYTVYVPDPIIGGNPFVPGPFESLDLQIDGQFTEWVPVLPSVTDGGGVVAGCNTTNHTYSTVILGGTHRFRIIDGTYGDNAGSLTVTIQSVP